MLDVPPSLLLLFLLLLLYLLLNVNEFYNCNRKTTARTDHGRRLGAKFGGTKKFFRGPISGKMSIFRVKISDDLFSVIDLVLRIFPFFSHSFRMFTMLNVVYDHFLTRKPPFFTLFILSRTSDNTASQNIGGTVPPVPLGLRPWN